MKTQLNGWLLKLFEIKYFSRGQPIITFIPLISTTLWKKHNANLIPLEINGQVKFLCMQMTYRAFSLYFNLKKYILMQKMI